MKIILGSQSSGRKSILEKAGYTFTVMSSNIDEKAIRTDDYEKLPLLLARAKATALLSKITAPVLLITSDQIVIYKNELREKPESKEQAENYLKSYRPNFPAQTITAVLVTNTQTGKQAEGVEAASVFFKTIPDESIKKLVDEGKIMQAAGGFILEHPLIKPYIKKVIGHADSVTGLPLKLTQKLLKTVS